MKYNYNPKKNNIIYKGKKKALKFASMLILGHNPTLVLFLYLKEL